MVVCSGEPARPGWLTTAGAGRAGALANGMVVSATVGRLHLPLNAFQAAVCLSTARNVGLALACRSRPFHHRRGFGTPSARVADNMFRSLPVAHESFWDPNGYILQSPQSLVTLSYSYVRITCCPGRGSRSREPSPPRAIISNPRENPDHSELHFPLLQNRFQSHVGSLFLDWILKISDVKQIRAASIDNHKQTERSASSMHNVALAKTR